MYKKIYFFTVVAAILAIGVTIANQNIQPALASPPPGQNKGDEVSSAAEIHDDAVSTLKERPGWDPNDLKAIGEAQGDVVSAIAQPKKLP